MSDRSAAWHLAGTGPVAALERHLTDWYGLPRALAVSSATSGLLGVGLALDLRGAEFITTPYTWGGSLAPWLLLGCTPVFADVDPQTMTLDPESVAERITPRTRAILAVDIDGTPCDSAALRAVADAHGLWYVADAAQSLGATRHGRPASADAHAIVVSFTAGKTVDAGEGGAVVTRHDWLHERLVWLTQHPQRQIRELGLGARNELAINARIHPAAARVAADVFSFALGALKERQRGAFAALEALEESGLTEPAALPGTDDIRPSFYRLTVACRSGGTVTDEALEGLLRRSGMDVRVEPTPVALLHRSEELSASRPCPVAEDQWLRRRVLRLRAPRLSALTHARRTLTRIPFE